MAGDAVRDFLLDDIFEISDKDPDGKKFDKGAAAQAHPRPGHIADRTYG